MDKFATLFVSGAITGAIYSLVASGLILSYTATGIFNFSYGGIAFSSAYLYYELHTALHWHVALAAFVTIGVFAPLLAILLDKAVFRHLARAGETAKIVATVGLLIAIPALTMWIIDGIIDIFGVGLSRSTTVLQVGFPPGLGPVPQKTWHVGRIPINSNELVVLVISAICAAALWWLLRWTKLGLQMRAVVDRSSLAGMRGIDEVHTSRIAWIIGSVLAAIAGVVGAPLLGSISMNSFVAVMFVASAAVVVGRFRSIPLAFIGGLLLGAAQDLVSGYARFASGIPGFSDSVPTLILLVLLLILGVNRGRIAGLAADERPPPDYLANLPRWRRATPWVIATGFLIVYIAVLANDFWAGVMAEGLALGVIYMSFVVVTGMGGMVSLAQSTFVTAAALTTGMLFGRYHWPLLAAAVAGVVVAVLLGLLVAIPALRLGGLSLALATLALAILGDNILFQWSWLTNSSSGWVMPRLKLGGFSLENNRTMGLVLLAVVGLIMLLIHNLQRSPWGRSIAAVRSSAVGAATSGISPLRVKLALFAISAGIAGVGGILYTSFQTNASSVTAPYESGFLWLAIVVLFGIRRPVAAALAGVVGAATPVILQSGFHWWSWVPSFLSWNGTPSSEIPMILFGMGAVTLARNPDGFLSANASKLAARRRKKAAKSVTAVPVDTTEIFDSGEAARAILRDEVAVTVPGQQGRDPETTALLVMRSVHAGYDDVEVLHGIDITLREGTITTLFGANGSGKSTVAGVLCGLLPTSAGRLLLHGKDISRLAPHQRVGSGILVAPETRGIFPGLSVEENLSLRLGESERKEVYSHFPVLGERRRVLAGSLSGGEQQMLALGQLLVRPPRVLVADEPTLGLAPKVIELVLTVIAEIKARGTAVMLIEEKVRDLLAITDEIALLQLGRIVWSGKKSDVESDQLLASYLGAERATDAAER